MTKLLKIISTDSFTDPFRTLIYFLFSNLTGGLIGLHYQIRFPPLSLVFPLRAAESRDGVRDLLGATATRRWTSGIRDKKYLENQSISLRINKVIQAGQISPFQ